MNRLGGKILRPIEGQQVVILKEHHRFQGLAALELSKDALEQRAHRFGGDGIEYLAHLRVARHAVNRVDRPQVPSTRCLSKASSDGDLRENRAKAAMSASVKEISVSLRR